MLERVVVTGGSGKTGRRVVARLREDGLAPRVATRMPKTPDAVRFDWRDPTSFADAFRDAKAVYLVAPTDDFDTLGAMRKGLEAALASGVRRFVLLSASSLEEGGPMMGAVHAWLRANSNEWAVLRPSWFMQNLSEGQHREPIRTEASIHSATGEGRVGFIDAEDIARCAAALLTAPQIENTDYVLTGPAAVSYDDVAKELSQRLGRTIHHLRLPTEGVAARFEELGLPARYAQTLAAMDEAISRGSEDRVTNAVLAITGRAPISLESFIDRHVEVWR